MTGPKVRRMCLVLGAAIAQASAMAQAAPKVKFQTSQGEFVVELYRKAPSQCKTSCNTSRTTLRRQFIFTG